MLKINRFFLSLISCNLQDRFRVVPVQDGEVLPDWLVRGDYEFDVELGMAALLRKCEQFTSLAAISRASGINQQQLSHYASGLRTPRQEQRKRIIDGIHRIGQEFLSVV